MDRRHRPLATALLGLAFAGCSAVTSFDGFVGPGGSSGSTPTGSSGSATSGGTSGSGTSGGGTSGGGTSGGGTSGGTSGGPSDGGKDGPCVNRNTGPTRGTLVNGANGGVAWLQATNALAADGTGASVTLSQAADDSALLVVTGFGLAVPAGARIVGIRVFVVRRAADNDVRDEDVHLMSDNNPVGENKAQGEDLPLATYASITYGSGTDVWGSARLTSALVNDPSFGVAFRAGYHGDVGTGVAEIDEMRIDVAFCE